MEVHWNNYKFRDQIVSLPPHKYACPCTVPTPEQCRDGSARATAPCSLCPLPTAHCKNAEAATYTHIKRMPRVPYKYPIIACTRGRGGEKQRRKSDEREKAEKNRKKVRTESYREGELKKKGTTNRQWRRNAQKKLREYEENLQKNFELHLSLSLGLLSLSH